MKTFKVGQTYTNGIDTVTITKRVLSNKGVRFNGRFYRALYHQWTPHGTVEAFVLGSRVIQADWNSATPSLWQKIKALLRL